MELDTIAAVSTPPGEGAINIVRLSGEQAVAITDKVYRSGTKDLAKIPTHTVHYGHIANPQNDQLIDKVMLSVMRAPETFTRKDVVEINCHGGIVVVSQLLQLLLREGARIAEPGEFTKYAFLNGRIDLPQAETVMGLIRAKTDKAMNVALNQLDGDLLALIRPLRQEILNTLAQVGVNIDYPEYDDVEELTAKLLLEKARFVKAQIQRLLAIAKQGKILREGLNTAIIGRPNVGKSSLLNHLLREEKAIVTDIAGTIRDVIEEYVNIRGVPLKLIGTTGVRGTEDIVERIGVERSRKALADSSLILLVLNQSEELIEEDRQLLGTTKGLRRVILLDKMDLPAKLDSDELQELVPAEETLSVPMLSNTGLDQLETRIADLFFGGQTGEEGTTYTSNTHHIALLNQTALSSQEVINGIEAGMSVDLVQIDMTHCQDCLGEIINNSVQDELITQLFSQFCLGK